MEQGKYTNEQSNLQIAKTSAGLLDRNSKHTAMAATACQKPRFLSLLSDLPGSDLKKIVDLMEISTLKLIFSI